MDDLMQTWVPDPAAGRLPGLVRIVSAGHWATGRHRVASRIRHDHLVLVVQAGRGWLRIGTRRWSLEPGWCFHLGPGWEHGYGPEPGGGWEIRWVHLAGTAVEELSERAGFSLAEPVLGNEASHLLKTSLERLGNHLDSGDWSGVYPATATLIAGFYDLAGLAELRAVRDSGIDRVLDLDPESVDEMAAVAGLSRAHFVRRFKAAVGVPPWRWVLARRIARAQALLGDPQRSIKEVARASGFTDPDYFSRCFRRETGLTASAWRSQLHA